MRSFALWSFVSRAVKTDAFTTKDTLRLRSGQVSVAQRYTEENWRLSDYQYFADVVTGEEKLDGSKIAE